MIPDYGDRFWEKALPLPASQMYVNLILSFTTLPTQTVLTLVALHHTRFTISFVNLRCSFTCCLCNPCNAFVMRYFFSPNPLTAHVHNLHRQAKYPPPTFPKVGQDPGADIPFLIVTHEFIDFGYLCSSGCVQGWAGCHTMLCMAGMLHGGGALEEEKYDRGVRVVGRRHIIDRAV